jgi:methionine sulfoxide reductase heme-binding subunit
MPFLREKNGRWSPEKVVAFAAVIAPALWLIGRTVLGDLGPRPVTEAIHFVGRWTVRFLLLSLAITPARRLIPAGRLINARRTLGVAACCYIVTHFTLFVVDSKYDLTIVATEISERIYLIIGLVALIGFIALGVTSTDAAVRRLGARWTTLHRAAYVIGVLGIIHFMMQKKLDIYEPTLMAGFLLWLLGYRLCHRYLGKATAWHLVGLAVASAILTALLQAFWYRAMTGVDPLMVLETNLMFDFADLDIQPAWWVLAAGLAVPAAQFVWQRFQPKPAPRARLHPAE